MARKRPRRAIVDSDGYNDDDVTFINNSDYAEHRDQAPDSLKEPAGTEEVEGAQESEEEAEDTPNISERLQTPQAELSPKAATTPGNGTKIEDGHDDLKTQTQTHQTPPTTAIMSDKTRLAFNISLSPPGKSSTSMSSPMRSEYRFTSPSKRRETVDPFPRKPNEPRLVISEMVLDNFKSYAGKQVIGPFNHSFSAVIGPNGSGKSNVIDSMLFVFGFRASKMRQGKLSELIHSSDGQKLDYCQVDIHFHNVLDSEDEPGSATVLPDSELTISRKAFRNNGSQYYINGRSSSYTEVTTLLRDKGIDLDHKRFLILQGEVESIAQMKPKAEKENDDGLLEYLEDIIGTASYKSLIEENLVKIEGLNDVCLEKENRYELVEKDKDDLESKKDEALEFLLKEKELINKKSLQFQSTLMSLRKTYNENELVANEIKEKLQDEKLKTKDLDKSIEEIKAQDVTLNTGLAKVIKELSSFTTRQKQLTASEVSFDEKQKHLENKIKKITKSKEQLEHKLRMTQQEFDQSKDERLKFEADLKALENELEVEKAKLNELRSKLTTKTAPFSKEIQEIKTQLTPWTDRLKQKENALQLIRQKIEIIKGEKENSIKQIEDAKQRLHSIKVEGKLKETALLEAEDSLTTICEQIQLGEQQCAQQQKEVERKKQFLQKARQKTDDAANSLGNFQNKNKVLSNLFRLLKSGRISGFHGRLGDLGVIDEMYDVAISTVCPGLDSLVVDTVETAQICIDYLRKNHLGYAQFICLDKLRQFNLNPIHTPGNPRTVKRLFDLIEPQDPRFAPAFYSKVYNTLVVSTLSEARQVAHGARRWKVVTLSGEVVDTSGTMSGGGNYKARGSMRLKGSTSDNTLGVDTTPEEVQEMKAELQKLDVEFEQLEAQFQELQNALRKLNELKPTTEFKISSLRLDIETLIQEKKNSSATYKRLVHEFQTNNLNEKFTKEIEEKEVEVKQLEAERSQVKSEMKDMEDRVQMLENKILEAGGIELRLQSSKVDSVKQQMEILNSKSSDGRISAKKLENDIKRYTKLLSSSESELEAAKSDLELLVKSQVDKTKELKEIELRVTTLESSKLEMEEELESIRDNLNEQQREINHLKSTQIELENRLEKYTSVLKKAQIQIESNEEHLRELSVREVIPLIQWMSEEEQEKYNSAEITQLTEEELDQVNIDQVDKDIEQLEQYMSSIKVDVEVLLEYGQKLNEFESRKKDLNLAVEERDEVKNFCEDLKRKRLDEFMEGFNIISMSLKEMYQMITMGGNAELELVDSLDPFSEGILFSVMPPKKSWKNISNLSGGEKTLSSLALVFALHRYKPTPLYVMDEIDAALDFRNVSIVANYIKERTKNAQFVVISLRNNMFELAKQLVGIYKVNNMTKSISLKNQEIMG
ncbi:uncharacterized protein KQ657_002352 [Scheffersomyces spartinae]|uniref:Structural maintenance of chromosomes protein n=1 Tax=Scheffersomyces spartinae TaxID=45513 RepID=A0A9P7VDS5_9ASCO|nr:uncharacterized protein KQ657_002352 [Scheffersomyces spartinae]KAG7195965.1 hypothetical protein KQ657_002352 [Scheffersomyces spartinae]